MANSTRSIDKAQTCAACYRAIEELLTQAGDGCNDMHLVNPGNLASLIVSINNDLESALDDLSDQFVRARLRTA